MAKTSRVLRRFVCSGVYDISNIWNLLENCLCLPGMWEVYWQWRVRQSLSRAVYIQPWYSPKWTKSRCQVCAQRHMCRELSRFVYCFDDMGCFSLSVLWRWYLGDRKRILVFREKSCCSICQRFPFGRLVEHQSWNNCRKICHSNNNRNISCSRVL